AAGDLLAALAQDVDHVERRAAADAEEQHLHGPDTHVAAAGILRAVQHDAVPTAGFGNKHCPIHPLHGCLHAPDSWSIPGHYPTSDRGARIVIYIAPRIPTTATTDRARQVRGRTPWC